MAMAGENEVAKKAIAKVEKFLALAPWAYGNQFPIEDETERKAFVDAKFQELAGSDLDVLDPTTSEGALALTLGDEFMASMIQSFPSLGVMSKQTMLSNIIGASV